MNPTAAARIPRETPQRCALRAQLRGDPMLGTAFPAARLLLVEQPGPWGRAGLTESHFPAATAAAVERRASAAGIRVQAIRRPGRTEPSQVHRWALADTRDGAASVRWATYTDPAELLDAPLDGTAGAPDPQPVFLVCTHSRRDTCCALRGRPVAAALDAHLPGQVWESSHLGGDRFGANVLVLPDGLLYGRVLPFAAEDLVGSGLAGEVVPPLLRGRIGLSPAAQAALGFAHEQLGVTRNGALRVLTTGPVAAGEVIVRVGAEDGEFDVTVSVSTEVVDGLTCRQPGPGRFLAWRPVRITPAPLSGS